jgi:hypothetical protein
VAAIDKEFVLEVPAFLVFGEKDISKRITENLLTKLILNSSFLHLFELTAGFNIRPFADDLVGTVQFGSLKEFLGRVKKPGQEQGPGTARFAITGLIRCREEIFFGSHCHSSTCQELLVT